MKMMPIKFRAEYSDYEIDKNIQIGFEPIKNEKENVWVRYVEIEFHDHIDGTYMQVRIFDKVHPKTFRMEGEYTVYDRSFDRQLYEIVIYDHPSPNNEFATYPTMAQASLMNALRTGDIRGEYANRIVNQLFVDLVVLNPKSDFGQYLPKIKAFYEDLVAKGHWGE